MSIIKGNDIMEFNRLMREESERAKYPTEAQALVTELRMLASLRYTSWGVVERAADMIEKLTKDHPK